MGADAGRLALRLPLDADDAAQHDRRGQPRGDAQKGLGIQEAGENVRRQVGHGVDQHGTEGLLLSAGEKSLLHEPQRLEAKSEEFAR